MSLRAGFLKTYANIPMGMRGEIVAVIDNEAVTWNSAKIEIEQNTAVGEKILGQLKNLEIIKDEDK